MVKKKVAFATGSRADYGIMRRYLGLLDQDEKIALSILATGALLSPAYGCQAELIYRDGFQVDAEIELDLDSSSNAGILCSMAQAMERFGDFFEKTRYDLLVILQGKTLREVSSFVSDKLSTLDSVLSTATHFILKKYKDYGTILGKKSKDERMLVTP